MAQDSYYSIGEVSEMLGVPSSTIRFYDKKGLMPGVARSEGGIRRFTEADVDWLRMIEGLKMLGMSLAEISEITSLHKQGNETLGERYAMIHKKRDELLGQMEELQRKLDLVNCACWLLETASKEGTLDAPLRMIEEKIPPEIEDITNVVTMLQAAKAANERHKKVTDSDSK